MEIRDGLRYTKDHEWARNEASGVVVGITDYAQDALGDVVFVSLPEVGRSVTAGEAIAEVESTKSVSEIYAPVAGTIATVNDALSGTPENINADPYGDGWICSIRIDDAKVLDDLLSADDYKALTES